MQKCEILLIHNHTSDIFLIKMRNREKTFIQEMPIRYYLPYAEMILGRPESVKEKGRILAQRVQRRKEIDSFKQKVEEAQSAQGTKISVAAGVGLTFLSCPYLFDAITRPTPTSIVGGVLFGILQAGLIVPATLTLNRVRAVSTFVSAVCEEAVQALDMPIQEPDLEKVDIIDL